MGGYHSLAKAACFGSKSEEMKSCDRIAPAEMVIFETQINEIYLGVTNSDSMSAS